jgi:DNA polymerase-3 subunit delta
LIIIQNAHLIKENPEGLIPYLNNPSETTILVFVAPKIDAKKKIFSILKNKTEPIVCQTLYKSQVKGWILQEGKKKGLHFTEEALWFLQEHLGNDLFLIQQEMNKLSVHLGPQATGMVALQVCQAVIGGGRYHSVFELLDRIGKKDVKGAILLLESLHAEGEYPLVTLSMLLRQWRMMAHAREEMDSGLSESAVGGRLPLPPSFRTAFLKMLCNWDITEIQAGFSLALAADSALKGGAASSLFTLEALLIDLICKHPRKKEQYTLPFLRRERTV